VVVNFERDLDSEPAKKIHRESKALGLPTLNDVRDAFERKARDLGLNAQGSATRRLPIAPGPCSVVAPERDRRTPA
jgi:hypothetical protein